ncbi:hypothetical protein [Burkholderia sp. PAMC 26561]|uniref:hypothetical protein n=1 Tax=Burkholderia sp. PAMC 26561 TaxID=1795043 RepID=UPI00076B40B9|nr:hypothetical protein AXG89_41690 [Burkholderia sp. PAMC 26561]
MLFRIAYDFTKGYGVNSVQYHQAALGACYFLSKRTDLYLAGVFQHASGSVVRRNSVNPESMYSNGGRFELNDMDAPHLTWCLTLTALPQQKCKIG